MANLTKIPQTADLGYLTGTIRGNTFTAKRRARSLKQAKLNTKELEVEEPQKNVATIKAKRIRITKADLQAYKDRLKEEGLIASKRKKSKPKRKSK